MRAAFSWRPAARAAVSPASRRWLHHVPTIRSQRLRCGQDLVRVAGHLHLAPDFGDPALTVDEVGRALDAEIFPAVHALFLPHAVGFDRRFLRVGGERDGEAMLPFELVVAGGA